MSWTDDLSPASFRGVPFSVSGDPTTDGGRKNHVHEFPGRDLPYVEDLGRKARQFQVTAFVVGDNFKAQRDALLEACETAGPGTLVHPFFGSLRVSCQGFSCADGKRMSTIGLTFIESGAALHPTSTTDTPSLVSNRADTALVASGTILDETVDYSGSGFVLESALDAVVVVVETVSGGLTAVADPTALAAAVLSITGMDGPDLAGLPSLSETLAPLFSGLDPDGGIDQVRRAAELLALTTNFPLPAIPARLTPSRLLEQSNLTALADFATRSTVAELARSASRVVPESVSAAALLRDQVTGAVDAVLDRAGDDEVFTAFQSLRSATVRDLAERAKQAPKVVTLQPRLVDNALTLAHRAQGTIADMDALLRRNNIRHPGFPGHDPLEVLRG